MKRDAHLLPVTEHHILVFAFRYALGRMSAVPSIVAAQLKVHWPRINESTRRQIQREISETIQCGQAGHACDVWTWREVLALPIDS